MFVDYFQKMFYKDFVRFSMACDGSSARNVKEYLLKIAWRLDEMLLDFNK